MSKTPVKILLFLIQKRFLQSSATISATSSLGTRSSASTSQKLQLVEKQGHVVEFFKSHGFSDTHIAKLGEKVPRFLKCKVEKNLKPKMDFLKKEGFVGECLVDLIVSNPNFLTRGLHSHIKPTLMFLKLILGSNERIVMAAKRSHRLLCASLKGVMQPNVDLLKKEGVPIDGIAKMFMWQPRTISLQHDRIVYIVNVVKNLGVTPTAPLFVHCVRVMGAMNESTLKKKMEFFRSLGWSEEQLISTFSHCPQCFTLSEGKIRRTMNFYINNMKLAPDTIIAAPYVLYYSLDRTIRPRYEVVNVLETKKLIKRRKNLSFIRMSEKKFLEDYVMKHADKVPGLLEVYNGAKKA